MFTLSENNIKAIHARLEAELPRYIDQVNAELVDPEYPIEQPVHIYDFIPTTAYMTDFPVVAIGDGEIFFDDDVGWSATGNMDFAIVVWVQHPDQQQLAWMLRRYMIAIANCILEGRNLAAYGGGWGLKLGKIEPGPTLGRKEKPREFLSMRALTLSIRDEQDA